MNKVALFWDESYLWGIMTYKSLKEIGISFDILTRKELSKNLNNKYNILVVPGGWASNKKTVLGDEGISVIRDFVYRGGSYLGLCGGAGLATSEGIDLLDIKRVPSSERVPSMSGRVKVTLSRHVIWEGIKEPVFYLWWPSQFYIDNPNINTIASYENVLDDAFSSDFNISNVREYGDWQFIEKIYGINLNPDRLIGSSLVVEGGFGNGKVLLSLLHFDTPNDTNGQKVMKNIFIYLSNGNLKFCKENEINEKGLIVHKVHPLIEEIQDSIEGLIDFGIHNFLWFWRHEMILGWRRGIRGFECCNLYIMVKELCRVFNRLTRQNQDFYLEAIREIRDTLRPFIESLKELLFLERVELQRSQLTSLMTQNPHIDDKRAQLFSKSKSYGGKYKELIMLIDNTFLKMLRQNNYGGDLI